MVNKDADITNEIYSLSTVDFDRQVSVFLLCSFTFTENSVTLSLPLIVYIYRYCLTFQELRKLVRNFCSLQDHNATPVENEGETKVDKKLLRAEKHLNRFLVSLAKQLPTEEDYIL